MNELAERPLDTSRRPVAVLGAGTMGSAMTHALLRSGLGVRVWNRSAEPLRNISASGAETFSDAADAVRDARVVLTLLPTADVVQAVMFGSGTLEAMRPGAVWAQMGTIGIEETRRLDTEVRRRRGDVLFVDAPVSGSRAPAEAGELVILASGPDDAKASIDDVFDALGRRTLWLGPAGMGTSMKLVLNTWLAFEVEAAAEVAALAGKWGIPDEMLTMAVTGSPLASSYAASKLEKMQSANDDADFALGMALKDLGLVEEAAGWATAPVVRAIAERWHGLVARGFGGLDVSAARLGLDVTVDHKGS